MTSPGLKVKVAEGDGGIIITLAGAIDEQSEPKHIVPRVAPLVVFDLDGIERVTSYGVINWLSAIKTLDGKQYAFAHCRPSMVRQFNMITGFGRQGQLLSVYLPYFCADCGDEYEQLLDLINDYGRVSTHKPPVCPCPKCGTLGEFDDAAETYFSFGADYGAPRPSLALKKLIASMDRLPIAVTKTPDAGSKELQAMREELKTTADRLAKLRGGRDS